MMKLKNIFEQIEAQIPIEIEDLEIRGLHYDSRKIGQGDLFIAVPGFKVDGHSFLAQVREQGAAAAVVEQLNPNIDLPQIQVSNARNVMAGLSANFYKQSLDSMRLVGITGTNGKTSCGFLIQSILEAAGYPAGLIGTIAYFLKDKSIPAWNTTPEAIDLSGILDTMYKEGLQSAVLEVSSHALSLNRVDGLRFDAALFTNLSRDHLDFHQTEQDYFEAKSRLFNLLKKDGVAVLNLDDPYGEKLAASVSGKMINFGFNDQADVCIKNWQGDLSGLEIQLEIENHIWTIHSKLIGAFNVQNITAAVAVGYSLGIGQSEIIKGVENLQVVPGRLEVYPFANGVNAVIDYAHTPDALEKALQALRKVCKGKLIVLFGAGGDRDKGKRPLMGKAAEENADFCVVTSDNPRTEDAQQIINDILTGMKDASKRKVITNRREALSEAMHLAQGEDIILIAGKGHETYQDINGVKYEFDDAAILKEIANA